MDKIAKLKARRAGILEKMQAIVAAVPDDAEMTADQSTEFEALKAEDDKVAAELERARRLLRPGGWLVAHTMDIGSPLARLMGPRWPWLMDMHLIYFDRRTLPAMFAAHGFEVVWQGTQGRYLRLGYLASRVEGLHSGLGRVARAAVNGLGLRTAAIPVNFGDLITCVGRRAR